MSANDKAYPQLNQNMGSTQGGLTKREFFVAALAPAYIQKLSLDSDAKVAERIVAMADLLIARLENGK